MVSTFLFKMANSGGPLFNKYGNIVGINVAGIDNDEVKKIILKQKILTIKKIPTKSNGRFRIQPRPNIGINKLDIEDQYIKIKNFVYIIFGLQRTIDKRKSE